MPSTPSRTKRTPATPRKSARLSTKASHSDLGSESEAGSYAAAAAKTPGRGADALASEDEQNRPIPAVTPRTRRIKKEAAGGTAGGSASPARVTRSRSRGLVGSETD